MKDFGKHKQETIPADRVFQIAETEEPMREKVKADWFKEQSDLLLGLKTLRDEAGARSVEDAISRRMALEDELSDLLKKREEYIEDAAFANEGVSVSYLGEMDMMIEGLYQELYGRKPFWTKSRKL